MSQLDARERTVPATPWIPDLGDGSFRNPIICADYSDPDVIRDGDDYFMTASSFNCTPGLPILHSRDLVNWTLINHAVKNLPDPRGVYDTPQPGCGVWAPAIRKHAGKFWIFFPMPDEGIYVTVADHPAATWSPPHLMQAGKGLIDPCPLWDDDGRAYLVHAYARSRSGIKHRLRVCPMSPDGSRLLGQGKVVFDEPERHPTCEGPKFYKRHGYYYILAPAGGVATGWQLALRSRDIFGPYEEKVVLEQGSTPINGPHQGALVETPAGEHWFLHFQDANVYGRVVHMQPVRWEDDWPLMGIDFDGNGIGEAVPRHRKPSIPNASREMAVPQTSDDFTRTRLGLQWQWQANHCDDWFSLSARVGHLRLNAIADSRGLAAMPNVLLQKFPARAFTAETSVRLDDSGTGIEAGLIVVGRTHAAIALAKREGASEIRFFVNDEVTETHGLRADNVRLVVNVEDGGRCTFSYVEPNAKPTSIGEAFQATPGQWIGAKVGLYVRGGTTSQVDRHADFSSFLIRRL